MQSTKCQRGHLEDDPFWNAKPVKAKTGIGGERKGREGASEQNLSKKPPASRGVAVNVVVAIVQQCCRQYYLRDNIVFCSIVGIKCRDSGKSTGNSEKGT